MRTGGETKRKASLPETVGAWLRLWTAPRDVEVPPPPAPRTLAIGGVVALVVLAGAAALIVPAIDSSKDRAAAADAREAAQRRAESRRRTIAEQRPQRLDASSLRPSSGAPAALRIAARTALLQRAETAISADARRRAQAGELQGRPQGTECEAYPKRDPGDGETASGQARADADGGIASFVAPRRPRRRRRPPGARSRRSLRPSRARRGP